MVEGAWAKDELARPLVAELAQVSADPSDESACAELAAALSYVSALRASGIAESTMAVLTGGRQADALHALRGLLQEAGVAADAMLEKGARFTEAGVVDWKKWIGGDQDSIDVTEVESLAQRLKLAMAADRKVYAWAQYLGYRARAVDAGGEEICNLVDARRLDPVHAGDGFEAAAYSTVASSLVNSDPDLMRSSGSVHSQIRARFSELDESLVALTAEMIAHGLSLAPEIKGVGYGPVKEQTEESLIKQQAALQRPRVSIRELFRRAGQAIINLKPCVMMSPQSISQYLPPGRMVFDLVVMDEASQIRPEDALGAIARGNQVVIVGDPMQLGPTSFFDRQQDDGVDDETEEEEPEGVPQEEIIRTGPSVLERSESILVAAQARYPLRMLKWHYRSRNPRLIAFSNKEFYGGDLIVFPTPQFVEGEDGVFLRRVDGAVYEGHRNVAEAEAVVAALRAHAAKQPEKSVLVATLNFHQADLIDEMIQKAEKTDEVLAEFRRRHARGPEPLDVKNLENVQGDERDVILVSITFGPKSDGKFSRNFGPINQLGGERRLNVLFTRAKHRVEVFCSFDPQMLGVGDNSPRGLRVLHDYLRYAAGGTWATGAPNGRDPDSDFEIAVARSLRAQGLEVHFQVGVAGYWIDLGVVHPKCPGAYIVGIECDGANYHSAKSARDRDRLRQQVLEGYGWKIHRIWSTDWFRDSRRQVDAVVEKVQRLADEVIAEAGRLA
jgi:very-short-patch-repair endonuclease